MTFLFPSRSVTTTVPFFFFFFKAEWVLYLKLQSLAPFTSQKSIALWFWSWGAGGGGQNDLALVIVLFLCSSSHLRCWGQAVTGPRYMVPPHSASFWLNLKLMDVLILSGGHVWFSWGGIQLHSDPLSLGVLSEGQLCLASAWAFDDFSWISLLFPKSPAPAQILRPLDKEP